MSLSFVIFLTITVQLSSAFVIRPPPQLKWNPLRAHMGLPSYPQYEQCDPRWANDTMGVVGAGERSTICMEGCAMTSVSMALAGLRIAIDGELVTPKSLNKWLIQNGGYVCLAGDCNNLKLNATEGLTPSMNLVGEDPKPSFLSVEQRLKSGREVFVAHVRDRSHFVLLTGTVADAQSFYVNDPYYNVTVYPYTNISDMIRFVINPYPLYKQCDPAWGRDVMEGNTTICDVGCLMSSTSSALSGVGIKYNGRTMTPANTNLFLRNNGGYDPHGDMNEGVIPKLSPKRVSWPADGMHHTNDIPLATIEEYISQSVPRIVIANVEKGRHFVLVVGYRSDNDTLVVNDSGFERNTYSYAKDVVGWRIFDMH